MSVVIDASVAFAWVLPSQRTAAAALLSARTALWAPDLFAYEFRAGLLAAERRRRISRSDVDAEIPRVLAFVALAPQPDAAAHARILTAARLHGLSFYDAAYLELAQRAAFELASRDGALLAAATRNGITVIDAR